MFCLATRSAFHVSALHEVHCMPCGIFPPGAATRGGVIFSIYLHVLGLRPNYFYNTKFFQKFTGRLTIPSGLTISTGAFTDCAFANVIITRGIITTIGNYQALSTPKTG